MIKQTFQETEEAAAKLRRASYLPANCQPIIGVRDCCVVGSYERMKAAGFHCRSFTAWPGARAVRCRHWLASSRDSRSEIQQ